MPSDDEDRGKVVAIKVQLVTPHHRQLWIMQFNPMLTLYYWIVAAEAAHLDSPRTNMQSTHDFLAKDVQAILPTELATGPVFAIDT